MDSFQESTQMQLSLTVPIAASVFLSSSAQLLLKAGVSTPVVKAAFSQDKNRLEIILAAATSPMVILGLATFAVSVVVWLFVLSKVAVSAAYPFVSLGIVMTVIAGRFLFGEPLSSLSITGVALIVTGVLTLAAS